MIFRLRIKFDRIVDMSRTFSVKFDTMSRNNAYSGNEMIFRMILTIINFQQNKRKTFSKTSVKKSQKKTDF